MIKYNSKFGWIGLTLFIVVLLLMKKPVNAQKWYKITNNDIVLATLGVISGSADGVNQLIVHRNYGQGKDFWDFRTSWKRKYKDFDGGNTDAKYWGSKNIFVAFTDGFHLTRMIDRTGMLVSVGIGAGELQKYPKKDRWKIVAKKMLLSGISNRIAFNIVYQ
jgi:hypothetical protein